MKRRERLVKQAEELRTHWCGTPFLKCVYEIKEVDKKLISHLPQEQIERLKKIKSFEEEYYGN